MVRPEHAQLRRSGTSLLVLAAAWKTKPWQLRTWVEPVRDVAILVVVVLAVGASMLNAVPANVWILGLMLMLKGIVFFYLVLWHHFDDRDVRQFSVARAWRRRLHSRPCGRRSRDPSAFRGMLNLGSNADAKGQPPGLSSIFVFPVLFSWFMAFVAIFLFAHYVILRRLWMLGGALLFGAAVFLSGRRRAIVGVAVALVGGLVSQVRHGVSRRQVLRLWLPVGAAALVLAIIFAPGLQNLFERSVREWLEAPPPPTPQQQEGPIEFINGNPRLLLYQTSVDIAIKSSPLVPAWAVWQPNEPDRLQPCLYRVRPGPHLGSHAGVPGVRDGYVLAAHLWARSV